jgi:uncharacterized protein (UPF0332 family)
MSVVRRVSRGDSLFVSKLDQKRLGDLRSGVALVARTGLSIDELIARATRDRLQLARFHQRHAERLLNHSPPMYRDAVSRGYYALYHTFRATVFFMNSGDDFENHTILPNHLPSDFPDVDIWKNNLKSARLERNRADYDPAPGAYSDATRRLAAQTIANDAARAIPLARAFLRSKGWKS